MLPGVLVVIPLFHSFWDFGREVSLNPLEIAKVFNADMLRDQGSNSALKDMTKQFGEKAVQYGEVVAEGEKLNGGVRTVRRRLEIADPGRIIEPKARAVYF